MALKKHKKAAATPTPAKKVTKKPVKPPVDDDEVEETGDEDSADEDAEDGDAEDAEDEADGGDEETSDDEGSDEDEDAASDEDEAETEEEAADGDDDDGDGEDDGEEEGTDDEDEAGTLKEFGYQSAEEIKKAEAETDAARKSRYRPEFRIKVGQRKKIRFISEKPIIVLKQHYVPLRKKYGKTIAEGYFELCRAQVGTCPLDAEDLPVSLIYLYEVADVTGYKNKKGERVANYRCFLAANEACELILRNHRRRNKLSVGLKELSKQGNKKKPVWSIDEVNKKPLPDAIKEQEALAPRWREYYTPPSKTRLKMVVAKLRHRSASGEESLEDE